MDKLQQSFGYLNVDEEKEEKIVITDPRDRVTQDFLDRFEVTSILAHLTKEIADSKLKYSQEIIDILIEEHADNPEYIVTAYDIANVLLETGDTNLIIKREIGDNKFEYLLVDELKYYSTE